MPLHFPAGRPRSVLLAGALVGLLAVTPATAEADTPSPTPVVTPTTAPGTSESPTPSPSPTPSVVPTATSPSPAPSPSPTPAPPAPEADVEASATPALTLRVASSGSPVAGRFYQDVGRYAFSGTASDLAAGSPVSVYSRLVTRTAWTKVAHATVASGTFTASLPVTARGTFVFVATTGGAPGSGDEISSAPVNVEVADSTITLDKPAATVDALKNPALTGSVVPARKGVSVHVDVRVGTKFRLHKQVTTDSAGRFRATFGYGKGKLASYAVRATHRAANRDRWEISGTRTLKRVAVLNAVVTPTTAADVAKTYRKGCPVGRSKLSTIRMNFYGRDKVMHRGVLVIRTDLVPEVKRGFGDGLAARFPIAKLDNPNVYDGNDPRQMAANNTSGFNCRKVVGNPYAQSPHSYGTAIDVTPVQNPYRDRSGKWWPEAGKAYRDRTPLRFGMLGIKSAMTTKLRSDGFFWGGLWNPGRDYQHFEYRR
jgi:hypothetical protein